MKNRILGLLAAASTMLAPLSAAAKTEIQFWHAFTGRLGELVAAQVDEFNKSQNDYTVVATHKGWHRGLPRWPTAGHPDGFRGRNSDYDGRQGRD